MHNAAPQQNLWRDILSATVYLFALLAAVMLLVGHATSVSAQTPVQSAFWGEICGSGAPASGQDGQKNTCDHCEFCVLHVGGFGLPDGSALRIPVPSAYTLISYSFDSGIVPDRAEQYWGATRGPPLPSEEKTMTDYSSLTVKELAAEISTQWGATWI